jgi:pyrimidine operon attenuation protein/uracil phosphoribosyltransferase
MKTISSARACSDTRHRIAAPNSQPRNIKLVGLGRGGAALAAALDLEHLRTVDVLPVHGAIDPARFTGAEMLFMIACAGDDLAAAPAIKRVAREAGVLVTAILIDRGDTHAALPVLRAASDMLVVARDASYVPDMLTQLGA